MRENCSDNNFWRIDGGNGATFFFSAASYAAWRKSLEFYRAVSWRSTGKKLLLTGAYPLLKRRATLSLADIAAVVGRELGLTELPVIGRECSAMISPTRDKAIIHRHGFGYEKIAVGQSFAGIARELEIYRILARRRPTVFAYSRLGEVIQRSGEVHFFMHGADGRFSEQIPPVRELLLPLVEFFRLNGNRILPWEKQWDSLAPDDEKLTSRILREDRNGTTLVGLVHRDFKPWNVKRGAIPLFFDFESAAFDGCPLEDFFNYTVDPALRKKTPESVWRMVRKYAFPAAAELLHRLDIPAHESGRYWRWYLLERYVFWHKQNQQNFADQFLTLYDISR